jgi:hypothetical protein
MYSGEDKRTNIGDIFLRSRLHLIAATVPINAVLVATTIESTTQKQQHISDVVIALAIAS